MLSRTPEQDKETFLGYQRGSECSVCRDRGSPLTTALRDLTDPWVPTLSVFFQQHTPKFRTAWPGLKFAVLNAQIPAVAAPPPCITKKNVSEVCKLFKEKGIEFISSLKDGDTPGMTQIITRNVIFQLALPCAHSTLHITHFPYTFNNCRIFLRKNFKFYETGRSMKL